ncbi:hypothetical protein RHSIM_Rhsim01G0144200 [Rhododendron simsii]|uniref:Acyl carrier protein n=1 Tax=Rhododendron simsii TaxID=118357 RepID=A0A834LYD1_RHOSS|nr:hypothetical protein RHSIM_Rhsim01G0144200 [Rhododendron simsii]
MLRHIRVPVTETLTLNGLKWNLFNNVRSMSSHDDHITKEEVIHRVLDVVKSFPKVDPSKVGHSVIQRFLFHFPHSIYSCLVADNLTKLVKMLCTGGIHHLDGNIVKSAFSEYGRYDPERVAPDVHFQKDLGLDSLDNVEIVMALEEEFKLEIPDKEADKIDSCTLAIEYIHNHPMAS